MTRFILGTIRSEPDAQDPSRLHHNLDLAVELTPEENEQLETAQQALSGFLNDSQLFMIVAWNFNELGDLISAYLRAYAEKRTEVFTEMPIHLNVNRAFLNLLASIRSYLDFMDRLMNRRFGRQSAPVRRFRSRCSQEYDSNLSYRFLYKLRNYAQHKGFPIGRISLGQRPSNGEISKPERYLDVFIVRDEILEDFDWGSMAQEVGRMPELIDPAPHTISMMESLSAIHLHCVQELFDTLEGAALEIVRFGEQLSDRPGQPAVFEVADDALPLRTLRHWRLDIQLASSIAGGNLEDVIRHPEQG
jgi:hypothetical protein